MNLRARYRITMASGRDYVGDWMPSGADATHAQLRHALLDAVNEAGGRGLLQMPYGNRKVGLNLAQVELVEVDIEDAQTTQ